MIYQVETSPDFAQWIPEVVSLPLGPDQRRTASVPRSGPGPFLRLKVVY